MSRKSHSLAILAPSLFISEGIMLELLKQVHYLAYQLSSPWTINPGCLLLNQMKLTTRSLQFFPHKAPSAASAHKKKVPLTSRVSLPHMCQTHLNLDFLAKGPNPNPYIKLLIINIFILVVHKFLKLRISKTGFLLPTSFPWKKCCSCFFHFNLCCHSSKQNIETHSHISLSCTCQTLAHRALSILLLKYLQNPPPLINLKH